MSSGSRFEPYAARQMQSALAPDVMGRVARLGLSPRQQELNRLWASYRGQQYSARQVDWDGTQRKDGVEAEAIASAGYLPPGYYDAGASFPIKFRRPSVPYHLRKVIVDRFTGLLFSDRKHPAIRVEGDSVAEDYIRTLAEVARLWPAMIMARTYGGSMGTTAIGFQFVDGKPVVEVHDPRWCMPTFEDRYALKLASIEKRYMFPVDELDPETQIWVQRPYWYRRIIDTERDVLFKAVPVGDGDEPEWEVEREVVHGFGFCPVVWTQNLPVQDDIDGDPDCLGVDDMCEQIDALLSQANQGILASCDPTLKIITDAELDSIKKGSKNALKLPQGSSADYMEINGQGITAALSMVESLREMVLEVAQCVLDQPGGASSRRTATEIEKVYASMLAKADVLREQYGERCIKPLLEMMVAAIRMIEKPRAVEGGIIRQLVKMPPRIVTKDDLSIVREPRVLPEDADTMINLNWGPYFNPSLDEAFKAVQAATTARLGGLLDHEHAVSFTAPYFLVEDARSMARKVQQEQQATRDALDDQLMDGLGGSGWGESKLTQAANAAKLVPPLPPEDATRRSESE